MLGAFSFSYPKLFSPKEKKSPGPSVRSGGFWSWTSTGLGKLVHHLPEGRVVDGEGQHPADEVDKKKGGGGGGKCHREVSQKWGMFPE